MIQPEPGRHVHFVPTTEGLGGLAFKAGEPHAAIITHVHSDRLVNLAVFDANGRHLNQTSVPLQQPGDPTPTGNHCRWMPYTVHSAAKKPAA